MDGGVPRLQERRFPEPRDFIGLDYSSLYLCKPKRSAKRDDGKDTYKLPHRLIEKKRRDRINECIAQLKDLLPEHLKLTTLGHLEKAVVLELTLKHLKALTALTEQQHQKIIALQNGDRSLKSPLQSDLDAFHSGFQTCAKEVLQYLARFESWTPREPRCAQLVAHLHAVATQFLPTSPLLAPQVPPAQGTGAASASGSPERSGLKQEPPAHCVPVIQRTQPGAEGAAEPDTDTDSGYGGEAEPRAERARGGGAGTRRVAVKQEPQGEDAPAPKRARPSARGGGSDPAALLGPLVAPFAPPAAPLCLPFYLLSPPAAAACVQPLLDRGGLERFLYPAAAAPFPLLYPGLPAAAAAFPCLSSVLSPAPEKAGATAALLQPEASAPRSAAPRARAHLPRAREPGGPEGAAPEEPSRQSGQDAP
ncbi:class E basic helix-loop-helix protein 41 [Ctenodactylus gundi]